MDLLWISGNQGIAYNRSDYTGRRKSDIPDANRGRRGAVHITEVYRSKICERVKVHARNKGDQEGHLHNPSVEKFPWENWIGGNAYFPEDEAG